MRSYNQRVECICQNQAHVQYFRSPRIHLTKQMWPLKKVYTRVYVCDIEKWHHEYYIYFAFQYGEMCHHAFWGRGRANTAMFKWAGILFQASFPSSFFTVFWNFYHWYCTATHLHVFQNKVWFMLCTKCGHVALRQVINSHHLMVLIQGVSIETPRFNLIRKNTDKVDGLESKNPFIFNFLPEAISKQLKRHFWLLSTTNLPSSISEILKLAEKICHYTFAALWWR